MASGAGAGPNTAMFSIRGAARPMRRATAFASAWSSLRDDDRGEAAEGRHGGLAPGLGLGGVEALRIAADQRGDHRRVGIVGLDEDAARLVAAPGAAGDLLDLLEAALGGAQVAALQAEVGVDHADQGEVGEMIALGDELGADDDVDLARLHRATNSAALPGDQIVSRGDDRGARVGEEGRDLVGDALDAGAAGDQAVLLVAFGAQPRRRHDMAAMVAGEAVHQPVLDHPGGAIGALEAVAAGAAQGQRRVAAAVEEQQATARPRRDWPRARRPAAAPASGRAAAGPASGRAPRSSGMSRAP